MVVRNAAVATNNISEGGFGFIFDAPISPGTLIRVTSGAVNVTDRVKHKTVVVKAGKSYLARAR